MQWFGCPEVVSVAHIIKDERPVSQESLAARLVREGRSESLAGKCYEPVEYDPGVLQQVKVLAVRRLLSVQVAEGIKRLALRGQGDLLAQVQELLEPVRGLLLDERKAGGLGPLVEWAQGYFQGQQYGYRSTWPCLDALLGPLARDRLFVLSGYRKVGKSIWGLSLALDVALQGGRVVFNALDMGQERTFLRLVSALTGLPFTKMWRKEMTSVEEHLYREAMGLLKTLPVEIVSVSNVHEFGRISKGCDMAVVDYLQLCTVSGGEPRSKTEQVTAVTHALKEQARDHFVLAMSQLSRAGDPMWSSEIENAADILVQLKRSEQHGKRIVVLDVSLHRDGPTGRIPYYVFHEVERALEVPVISDEFEVELEEGKDVLCL